MYVIKEEKMKLSKIFALTTCLLFFSNNANSVEICIKGNFIFQCSGNYSSLVGKSGWTVTCDGVTVKGVSACSSTEGSNVGTTRDSLSTLSSADSNIYCWCKMAYPVGSQWTYAGRMGTFGECNYNCASRCSYYMEYPAGSGQTFRNNIFMRLSDNQ